MITGVHLITGLIGSGKTLRAVSLIRKEVNAGRPVYACNINGLNIPGVIPFDDPKQWRDLPPGALLVVDEAQRYWRARRAGEVPDELQAMETSRHDGVAFLIITQQPTYLDKHLRGLVTTHEHLYRRMGASAAQLFRWERCVDDPTNAADKDGADQEMFVYPKQEYGSYQSSEQHTVKFKMGMKPKLIIAAFCVAAALIGWVIYDVAKDRDTTTPAARTEPVAQATASPAPTAGNRLIIRTASDYGDALQPLVGDIPWTAPAYVNRAIASDPHVYCLSTESTCRCVTEQGTPWKMRDDRCRDVARWGEPYNPYKDPDQKRLAADESKAQDEKGTHEPDAGSPTVETASSGAVISSGLYDVQGRELVYRAGTGG